MVLRSVVLFLLAGAAEIVGGWLVWQFWRNGRSPVFGIAGLATLALYGIIPTYQPTHFGRAYAAYGGVFIVLSLAWGWVADATQPDAADIIGAGLALGGVAVIMYWPR